MWVAHSFAPFAKGWGRFPLAASPTELGLGASASQHADRTRSLRLDFDLSAASEPRPKDRSRAVNQHRCSCAPVLRSNSRSVNRKADSPSSNSSISAITAEGMQHFSAHSIRQGARHACCLHSQQGRMAMQFGASALLHGCLPFLRDHEATSKHCSGCSLCRCEGQRRPPGKRVAFAFTLRGR